MKKDFTQVYQFKISLLNIKPLIWRRIQVPENYTFWDLHVAIQNAMGWVGYHLHQFTLLDPLTKDRIFVADPDEEFTSDLMVIPERNTPVIKWFSAGRKSATYEYDFGDGWEHKITFEKILPREKGLKYPRCIAGARACPPEDCGGPWNYQDICAGKSETTLADYNDFDPEHFDVTEIEFDDPAKYSDLAW
ncbi:MAG: hypothetical protein A2W25_15890 [candidate division Zixibacteria bacterium RBG_16_53_22]|nr:MAG: hypothetical protein A2W25_15890 [candidate division Zixibacteria bacterium RBG_16_53_22]